VSLKDGFVEMWMKVDGMVLLCGDGEFVLVTVVD
jgi:hypothetical protein